MKPVALVVAFLAVLAAGVFLTRREQPAALPPTTAIPPPSPAARNDAPPPPPSLSRTPPSPQAARVRQLLAELTARHPFGRGRQNALRGLLPHLTADDVRAALDETYGNETCNDLTHVLLEHLARIDAAAALAFARDHAFGVSPPWWLSVVGGLGQPQTALPDLLRLPAGEERTSFLSYTVGRWAASDRDAAIDYALHAAPEEARELALANAIVFTAHQDGAAGFDLALKYADRIADPNLVQQLATDWAARDFNAALARLPTLPDNATQQRALRGVAAVAAARDPSSALPLIGQVEDGDARAELYRQAALQWLHRDPPAARSWVVATNVLSEADKRYVLDADRFSRRTAGTP